MSLSSEAITASYPFTQQDIAQAIQVYSACTFDSSANAKEGTKAIATLRGMRVEIETRRKLLKAGLLEQERAIDGKAAELTAMIKSVEDPLVAAKRAVEDAKKAAKEAAAAAARKAETDRVAAELKAQRDELEAARKAAAAERAALARERIENASALEQIIRDREELATLKAKVQRDDRANQLEKSLAAEASGPVFIPVPVPRAKTEREPERPAPDPVETASARTRIDGAHPGKPLFGKTPDQTTLLVMACAIRDLMAKPWPMRVGAASAAAAAVELALDKLELCATMLEEAAQ